MKLLYELTIIFLISLVGEMIASILPIAIPAAIVSLALLLVLLFLKVIKVENIELTGNWMLSNMSIFFIPACVSLIEHTELLMRTWWQILVISIVSFFLTFIVSGYVVVGCQKIMNRRKADDSRNDI